MADDKSVQRHYAAVVDDYTEEYKADYRGYPANQRRLRILIDRMGKAGVKTVLDCGCGEASPMMGMARAGHDVWGFDFVASMVESARRRLATVGLGERVWQGSVMEPSSFRPTDAVPAAFDCCLAMGVFPHLTDQPAALKNMAASVKPGGRVMVEFRNELFSLFTANRHSFDFFRDELMRTEEMSTGHPEYRSALEGIVEQMRPLFCTELPPARLGNQDAPGYDAILSRFNNPLTARELFASAGLCVEQLHFYHFHAVPPMFERANPQMFRDLSLDMESHPTDWRGYFMASAYVIESVRA